MPSLISFLRPLRYDRVSSVVIIQTGPLGPLRGIVERVRASFPGCSVEVVLRGESGQGSDLGADTVHVVQYAERAAAVEALRRRFFDAIVFQFGGGGARGLRTLPFQLRGRVLVAFNDNLDHFPVNVFRLRSLTRQLGLSRDRPDVLLSPVIAVYLLYSVIAIHARGWVRRTRRGRGRGGAARRVEHRARPVEHRPVRESLAPPAAENREEVRSSEMSA